jgi:hypothetical protein
MRDRFELLGGDTHRFDSDIDISHLDAMWNETYQHARTIAPANSNVEVVLRILTKCIECYHWNITLVVVATANTR